MLDYSKINCLEIDSQPRRTDNFKHKRVHRKGDTSEVFQYQNMLNIGAKYVQSPQYVVGDVERFLPLPAYPNDQWLRDAN